MILRVETEEELSICRFEQEVSVRWDSLTVASVYPQAFALHKCFQMLDSADFSSRLFL